MLSTPRLWRFILQPLLVGAGAFLVVAIGSYLLVVPAVDGFVQRQFAAETGAVLHWVASLAMIIFLGLISGVLYLTLVSFFSSMLWEKLSLEVEAGISGERIEAKLATSTIVGDSISRGLTACVIALLSLCCGWVFFGIPAVVLAGWLGLHDYTAPAMMRRGILFGEQRRRLRYVRGKWSFLLASGLITLLPFVNVLMLPCLVAAGTLLVMDSEKRRDAP